jgi:hypothetical protein
VRSPALDLAENLLGGVVVAPVVEGDFGATLSQPDGDGPADAARAAGDQRDLTAQIGQEAWRGDWLREDRLQERRIAAGGHDALSRPQWALGLRGIVPYSASVLFSLMVRI